MGIHRTTVPAILAHVRILAHTFGSLGLEIEFAFTIVGAWNSFLGTRASNHTRAATVPILALALGLTTLLVQLAEAVGTTNRALFAPWALFGTVAATPAIHAHALGLLILEHARAVATADGPFGITRTFFLACEALETRAAGALRTLRLLCSFIGIFDEACTMPSAV